MKLKCNQDHWPAKEANMLGFGAKPRTKIEGLTKGTTYDAAIFPMVSGSIVSGIGSVETRAEVLIFNDDEKWEYYQLDLFQPLP